MTEILQFLGVVLSIAGAIILYRFGELPFGKTNLTYIYSDEEFEKRRKEEERITKVYKNNRVLGLIMTLLGIIILGIVPIIEHFICFPK